MFPVIPPKLSSFPYKEGKYEHLDTKWKAYKTKRIFSGDGWSEALTKEESENLGKIWRKIRVAPWKLKFCEVAIYVELSEKIADYRKRAKREKARFRKYQSRKKIRAAAKQGVPSAIKRFEAEKKSNREYISKIRKDKRSISPT